MILVVLDNQNMKTEVTKICTEPGIRNRFESCQLWNAAFNGAVCNWDEELGFMYKNSQGHLTVFCIVFV